jgi:hypothetical protein
MGLIEIQKGVKTLICLYPHFWNHFRISLWINKTFMKFKGLGYIKIIMEIKLFFKSLFLIEAQIIYVVVNFEAIWKYFIKILKMQNKNFNRKIKYFKIF